MALIRCPECGKEVSDQAAACIHCGYPLRTADLPARYALILTPVPTSVRPPPSSTTGLP